MDSHGDKRYFVHESSYVDQPCEIGEGTKVWHFSHIMSIGCIRTQAINSNGELVSDFVIQRNKDAVHILNAPSPGASASLAIADYVIDKHIL